MAISLLVVYKKQDEEAFVHLKELVTSFDDEEDRIVGTQDGSVRVIRCEEDKWVRHVNNGHAEKLADKFLFIGDITGEKAPSPSFSLYGVSYGTEDNRMYLSVDPKYKWDEDEYDLFLKELSEICSKDVSKADNPGQKPVNKKTVRNIAMMGAGLALFAPLAVYGAVMQGKEIKNAMNDNKTLRLQMLLYGISKIYYDALEKFVKA